MDARAWILYAFITACITVLSLLHYGRREPRGRGRPALAVLRAATLSLLVLLLFDPTVTAGGGVGRSAVALVDGSLSMRLTTDSGTRWREARSLLDSVRVDRVLLFGDRVRPAPSAVEGLAPADSATRLAPALRAALESGAGRVTVITDGAVEDAAEAAEVASDAGAPVDVRVVGRDTRANVGFLAVAAPEWMLAGDTGTARVEVGAVGTGLPDSVTVRLLVAGREAARARVATPGPGRAAPAELRFVAPAVAGGPVVRLDFVLVDGGSMPDDDRRARYIRMSERPAGVAVVGLRPGEEPRFLMPVLERALGIPVRGWLALADGRYIRVGAGSEAGRVDREADVRRAVAAADVVVLDGLGPATPAWARDAARAARRLLVLPAGPTTVAGVETGSAVEGDWYPVDSIPSSPIAGLLAGARPSGAPPLSASFDATAAPLYWAPLTVRRVRQGESRPVLRAGETEDGRRIAVALAQGFWRWAFAGGAGRDLYERLWAGVAGWLMEGTSPGAGEEPRPEPRVVPRSSTVRWRVPGSYDSLHVSLTPLESGPAGDSTPGTRPDAVQRREAATDTVIPVTAGLATTGALPPGTYAYSAEPLSSGASPPDSADADRGPVAASGGSERVTAATGELEVERYSPELLRPRVPLDGLMAASARGRAGPGRAGGGRPLHTTAWPYVLLVALLSAEWLLRRRWGLR